jgi:hypothetical protein
MVPLTRDDNGPNGAGGSIRTGKIGQVKETARLWTVDATPAYDIELDSLRLTM